MTIGYGRKWHTWYCRVSSYMRSLLSVLICLIFFNRSYSIENIPPPTINQDDQIWYLTLCGATVVASVLLTSNRIHADSRKLVEVTPYGLELIQADELEVGPNPPLMCIVDSGIDLSHPEFDASMINGIDNDNRFWEEPMKWDSDGTGHGTQLAGIIAAIGGNNIGIKGVGSFPLYITRAIDDDGESFGTDIQTALQQCVEANSTIILMGIGSPFDSNHPKALYENIVYEKGIMIIAAAGNNFEDQPLYPARYESVIAVGGVGENGAPWENSAQRVEFVGPAVDVPTITMKEELAANGTTLSNQTEIVNGTGSASASVAAAAGLVWSHFEECTNEQIRLVLARTADNRKELQREGGVSDSKPENDEQLGYGLPQVLDAYNALSKWGCDLSGIDEPTPAPTFEGTPGATGETGAPTSTSGVISTTKVVMNVWCIGVWGVLLAFFTF